ncbi:MAG: DNA recombination protein RmuC [Actinomycetota bacterium]|nr:DNA recombination protein RmuC [Actinomycetota bacterium]
MTSISILILAVALLTSAWLIVRSRSGGAVITGMSQGGPEGIETGMPLSLRLDKAAHDIASMATAMQERRRSEQEAFDAVLRLERALAGSHSKGAMGESMLAEALCALPADMIVRSFTIGGRVCEFGLRLSDGKILPVDSKWPALDLLGDLSSDDPLVREAAVKRADKALIARLSEVSTYIDPDLTAPMAVVAVPDAVFLACRRAHAAAASMRLTIVGYGGAMSLLLSIWHLHRAFSRNIDSERLMAHLHEIDVCMNEMSDRIEGHLARGLKQANNAVFELRSLVSSSRVSLAAISPEDPAGEHPFRVEAV